MPSPGTSTRRKGVSAEKELRSPTGSQSGARGLLASSTPGLQCTQLNWYRDSHTGTTTSYPAVMRAGNRTSVPGSGGADRYAAIRRVAGSESVSSQASTRLASASAAVRCCCAGSPRRRSRSVRRSSSLAAEAPDDGLAEGFGNGADESMVALYSGRGASHVHRRSSQFCSVVA